MLAAASIVIWHLYNVLVKHRNLSMFTGVLSHKIMEEEHALELERLDEGGEPWTVVPPEILARRRRVYFAVASVVVVLALALVVWMFTFEDTAITTLPQATRDFLERLVTELEAPDTLHPPLPPAAMETGTDLSRSGTEAGGFR